MTEELLHSQKIHLKKQLHSGTPNPKSTITDFFFLSFLTATLKPIQLILLDDHLHFTGSHLNKHRFVLYFLNCF